MCLLDGWKLAQDCFRLYFCDTLSNSIVIRACRGESQAGSMFCLNRGGERRIEDPQLVPHCWGADCAVSTREVVRSERLAVPSESFGRNFG